MKNNKNKVEQKKVEQKKVEQKKVEQKKAVKQRKAVGQKKRNRYTTIQVSPEFRDYLKGVRDKNHFDNYENTIKHLVDKKKKG